jgi:S1-C subfamily serine protease
MLRVLLFATLVFVSSDAASGQALSVLHIKVAVLDAEQKPMPVQHHVLLISDNPASAAPRQVTTGLDGRADVRLRPGNYTVESDRSVAFRGKAYQWAQIVDIVAGRDALLELTADNAEVATATSATAAEAPLEADPSLLLSQWQDSVVALWTPSAHASGFVIDAKGLILTNQRVIGTATSVEVQLSPAVKVAASVLAADQGRDVAILRIDPGVVASLRPVPLGCAQTAKPPVRACVVIQMSTTTLFPYSRVSSASTYPVQGSRVTATRRRPLPSANLNQTRLKGKSAKHWPVPAGI